MKDTDKNYVDPKDRRVREEKLGMTLEENWARLDKSFKANKKMVTKRIKEIKQK